MQGCLPLGTITFVLGFGVRLTNASASGHRLFISVLRPSSLPVIVLHASAFPEQFDYWFFTDLFIQPFTPSYLVIALHYASSLTASHEVLVRC